MPPKVFDCVEIPKRSRSATTSVARPTTAQNDSPTSSGSSSSESSESGEVGLTPNQWIAMRQALSASEHSTNYYLSQIASNTEKWNAYNHRCKYSTTIRTRSQQDSLATSPDTRCECLFAEILSNGINKEGLKELKVSLSFPLLGSYNNDFFIRRTWRISVTNSASLTEYPMTPPQLKNPMYKPYWRNSMMTRTMLSILVVMES